MSSYAQNLWVRLSFNLPYLLHQAFALRVSWIFTFNADYWRRISQINTVKFEQNNLRKRHWGSCYCHRGSTVANFAVVKLKRDEKMVWTLEPKRSNFQPGLPFTTFVSTLYVIYSKLLRNINWSWPSKCSINQLYGFFIQIKIQVFVTFSWSFRV